MLSLRILKSGSWDHNRNTSGMLFQYYLFNFVSTLADYSNTEICETKKKKIKN